MEEVFNGLVDIEIGIPQGSRLSPLSIVIFMAVVYYSRLLYVFLLIYFTRTESVIEITGKRESPHEGKTSVCEQK